MRIAAILALVAVFTLSCSSGNEPASSDEAVLQVDSPELLEQASVSDAEARCIALEASAGGTIVEAELEKEGDLLPEKEAYGLLPQCQVALITSTSIVNHTIDGLLDASRECREVVLLGASTPLLPEAFRNTPVTFLSGVIVNKANEILRIVSEGGGMRYFKNNIKKVNIRLGPKRNPI